MELKAVIEALLFASPKPLTAADLAAVLAEAAKSDDPDAQSLKDVRVRDIEPCLETLATEHEAASRSFHLAHIGGAWQFVTRPDYAPWLQTLLGERTRPARLSQPALETLTIIAYRQPLTRAEIEQIRGVSVDGVVQTLLERGLIEQVGRADAPGRPMTYGTTRLFLECFGLADLADLPAADELRRLPVEKPASLLTVEPGLATPPPDDLAAPTPDDTPTAANETVPTDPSPTRTDAPSSTPENPASPPPS